MFPQSRDLRYKYCYQGTRTQVAPHQDTPHGLSKKVLNMRTGKWLAYSVILFLFLRALILVQGRPLKSDASDVNQRLLSRTKRFSINEYLMLALSLFNGFVFLYNNVETFFPAVKTRSQPSVNSNNLNNVPTSAPLIFSPDITTTKSSMGILARNDDSLNVGSLDFEREKMINQIAEMLIRYCKKTFTRLAVDCDKPVVLKYRDPFLWCTTPLSFLLLST